MNATTKTARTIRSIAAAALLVSAAAWGQDGDPGQIDLSPLADAIGAQPTVNINFGPAMIRGFAETFRADNAELAGLLDSIAGLRLMVFEDVDGSGLGEQIAAVTADLSEAGWTPALEVRDSDAHVDIYLNESDQFVDGLVLIVTESSGTAVFANVYGDLDPAVIGQLIGSGAALEGVSFEDLAGRFQAVTGGESPDGQPEVAPETEEDSR